MAYPLCILIVDDDRVACELLRETVAAEGYSIITALNGYDALEKIRKNRFHLVITDLAMPDLDGLALLIEVKKMAPRLKVILMTACRDEQLLNEAVLQGVDGVVSKPLGPSDGSNGPGCPIPSDRGLQSQSGK